MALDKVLKIYDENGNPVDYDILASDVKFLPDGKDLPTKLTEMEDAIEDAAEGGGYTPPQGGIPKTDLAPSVQTSLGLADTALQPADKTQLQNAINSLQSALDTLIGSGNVQGAIDTFNEVKAFLDGIDTDDPTLANQLLALNNAISALQTALAGKISGIRANGASTTLPVDQNGIVELPPAGSTISPADTAPQMDGTASVGSSAKYAREDHVHPHDTTKLSKSDVSVETQGDGTVDINVKDDTYTINLNHEHEGMAKLVVDTAANLPDASEMESDTIYGELDDGEIATIYLGGYPFYGGGGGTPVPVLREPADDTTIDVGAIATGESSVVKTIAVKGRNLTQALTVAVTGTGFSVDKASIPAADANAGTTLTITCTNTTKRAEGTLSIASSEVQSDCTLVANFSMYDELLAVELTGSQYFILDYHTNPATKLEIDMFFRPGPNSSIKQDKGNTWIGTDENNTVGRFQSNIGSDNSKNFFYWFEKGNVSQTWQVTYGKFYEARSIWTYYNNQVTFEGQTTATGTKTTTQDGKLVIGNSYSLVNNQWDQPFSRHNMRIFSLTISEFNGTLLHLVPRRRYDGVVGLYDTENDKFYTSATNVGLVAVELT